MWQVQTVSYWSHKWSNEWSTGSSSQKISMNTCILMFSTYFLSTLIQKCIRCQNRCKKKKKLFLLYFKKLKYRLIKTLKIGESIFFSKDFKSTMIAGYSLHRPSSCYFNCIFYLFFDTEVKGWLQYKTSQIKNISLSAI